MLRFLQVSSLAILILPALESEGRADRIPLLIKALSEVNHRQGASIALARLGDAAVPALRDSLGSDTPDVRVWSAYTLGQIGPPDRAAHGDLIGALDSSDAALRAAATRALGKIGHPAAVTPLSKMLADKQPAVRREAAVALGQIGRPSQTATAELIAVLADPLVRPAARAALVRFGQPTVDQLVPALSNDTLRFDVAFVIGRVDAGTAKRLGLNRPAAADLPSLRRVLLDSLRTPAERSDAAASLAALDSDGFAVLIRAFEHEHAARIAATAFKGADPSAVELLVAALLNPRPETRVAAADALGQIGSAAGDAAPHLVSLLKDSDRDVRYHAVRALHELGAKAKPAVADLTEVILNARELEPTRQWAIKTLIVTLPQTHDAVVKALIEASQEENNYGVRQLARQQLRNIDADAADAAGIK